MIFDYLTDKEIDDYLSLQTKESKRLFWQYKITVCFPLLVYVLGYRDLGEFHKPLLTDIASNRDGSHRRLWLWHRGSFKSSLITEAHTIFLIVNDPNVRVLITSNTLDIAKTFLKNIKDHFIKNEEFRYFFKEFCPTATKDGKIEFGTTETFTVPNRKRVFKEHTVTCAGIGTNLTGMHFNWIKCDDLVTRDSVSNDEQIKASKEYYASLRQLFDNPLIPKEDVIGTTYHFNDLYQDLLKNQEFGKSYIPVRDGGGEIVFKGRFNEEGLKRLENDPSVGPYNFSAQMMLNPVNPKDTKFRGEWIKYYEELPSGLAEYICVDPASTQKKKSDYTAMERWGIDSEGKHYLLEGLRDKLTSFQRIERLFQMVEHSKNLKWVKYEVLGGRHGDMEMIKERQMNEKKFFFIKETKASTASKTDRIEQRLAGPYHAGVVLFPQTLPYKSEYDGKVHDFVQEIKLELLQFPFTEHDDLLDAQSQMFEEETIKGDKPKVVVKKEGMTADDWERYYKSIEQMRDGNPFATNEWIKGQMLVKKVRRLIYAG